MKNVVPSVFRELVSSLLATTKYTETSQAIHMNEQFNDWILKGSDDGVYHHSQLLGFHRPVF
jgi:hypothetical protein